MNCTIWLYNLVPIETSNSQNGPKTTKNSNRLAAPSILDPSWTSGSSQSDFFSKIDHWFLKHKKRHENIYWHPISENNGISQMWSLGNNLVSCDFLIFWLFSVRAQENKPKIISSRNRYAKMLPMISGSRILEAAGRLELLVVFGPFWPLEVTIGTKLYNQIVQFNRTYSSIYILVPIETSSGQMGQKRPKTPTVLPLQVS